MMKNKHIKKIFLPNKKKNNKTKNHRKVYKYPNHSNIKICNLAN